MKVRRENTTIAKIYGRSLHHYCKKKNYIQKNIFQKGLAENLFFCGCESWSRVHNFAQWWQGYLKFGEDLSWGIRINIRLIVLLIKKKLLRKNLLARLCLPVRKINRLPWLISLINNWNKLIKMGRLKRASER